MVPELFYDEPVAVVGDIHGCLDALRALLRLLGERPILVVGDVIDRGPDSRGVIELLIDRKARGVRGNHEDWFLRWASGAGLPPIALAPHIGGAATLASYGVTGEAGAMRNQGHRVPEHHLRWLRELPTAAGLSVCEQRYWLIHAGVDPSALDGLPDGASIGDIVPWLVSQDSPSLLWGAVPPEETMPTDRAVIMGHMSVRKAVLREHVIGIDTGAGTHAWGQLSAVLLPERRVVSVPGLG